MSEELYIVEKFVYHTHKEMDDGKSDSPRPCTRNAKFCYKAYLENRIKRYDTKWFNYPSAENTFESAKEKKKEVPKLVDNYWNKFCTSNKIDKESLDKSFAGADSFKVNKVVQNDKHQISAKEKKYGFEASTSTPKEKIKKDKHKLDREKKDREDRAGVGLFGDIDPSTVKVRTSKAIELLKNEKLKNSESRAKIKALREEKLVSSEDEDVVEQISKKKKKKKVKQLDEKVRAGSAALEKFKKANKSSNLCDTSESMAESKRHDEINKLQKSLENSVQNENEASKTPGKLKPGFKPNWNPKSPQILDNLNQAPNVEVYEKGNILPKSNKLNQNSTESNTKTTSKTTNLPETQKPIFKTLKTTDDLNNNQFENLAKQFKKIRVKDTKTNGEVLLKVKSCSVSGFRKSDGNGVSGFTIEGVDEMAVVKSYFLPLNNTMVSKRLQIVFKRQIEVYCEKLKSEEENERALGIKLLYNTLVK